jgi:hypothetical protein
VYGYAVVKCWGNMGSVDTLRKLARETYYDQQPLAQIAEWAVDNCCSEQKAERAAQLDRRHNKKGAGEEEQEMDIDIIDILMFLQFRSVSEVSPTQGASPEDVSTTKVQAWWWAQ